MLTERRSHAATIILCMAYAQISSAYLHAPSFSTGMINQCYGISRFASVQKGLSTYYSGTPIRGTNCQAVRNGALLATSSAVEQGDKPIIALTRELGKNEKLGKLLQQKGYQTAEIPCIAFEEGPDAPALPGALTQGGWEYVVVTSPEAAGVFLEGWEAAGKPSVTVACVGTATEDALRRGGVNPVFVPTKATGKTLSAELPGPTGNGRVLYPASSRAKTEVQSGLAARGFTVTRLDTYDTVSAVWSAEQDSLARRATVVTLASPSAVKTWAERVGTGQSAACIGETSASACKEAGFQKVFWPESPGMDGWVKAVQDAVDALQMAKR